MAAGAGLLINSYFRLSGVDPGFVPGNLLTTQIGLGSSYESPERRAAFCRALLERARVVPGVESASLIVDAPIGPAYWSPNVRLADAASAGAWMAAAHAVGTDYFETMGIRLLEGRSFTELDDGDRPGVVVVNQSMAGRPFHDLTAGTVRPMKWAGPAAPSLNR